MTLSPTPHVVIVAGPNGAGKSTTAPTLLKELLGVTEFVNADVIAQGLSAFDTEAVAFQAGRVMLTRLRQLAAQQRNFAFETTLASRSYALWISQLRREGYKIRMIFLWLPNPETAVARVAERVRMGGHNIPETVIRRRYNRGIRNFFGLYCQQLDSWRFYNNAMTEGPVLIASGGMERTTDIEDQETWNLITSEYS